VVPVVRIHRTVVRIHRTVARIHRTVARIHRTCCFISLVARIHRKDHTSIKDIHQQRETSDLQHGIRPVDGLPAESKTDNPDCDSSEFVSDTPRSGGYVPGDAETEGVEEADGECDDDERVKDV